jgi:DNA-binding NtrC family response regulator
MKIKVLLVDDEVEFIDSLAQRLELRGFTAQVADSGKAALEFLSHQSFDVVVLDVLMPEMDGMETLKQIREIAPLTQVIMLTGHGTVDNAIQGMKNGAFDFLMKPVDIQILLSKINAAFEISDNHHKRMTTSRIESIVSRRGW